jgi:site-specific DNA recombinase
MRCGSMSCASRCIADSRDKPSKVTGAAVACTATRCARFSIRHGAIPRVSRSASARSVCHAHYILHDARSYACSGHKGGACDNHIRVRRDALETAILGPLRNEMLAPERAAQMAKEMQRDLLERMHRAKVRASEQPQELQELDARITRLRKRLAAGDPDITPDELQAALDRAEYKRRELAEPRPTHVSESTKLLTILPNAAE